MWALRLCTEDAAAKHKFVSVVHEYIAEGATDFRSLSFVDACKIVGYYINALDDKTEWLVESNKSDKTINLLTALMTGSRDKEIRSKDFLLAIQDQAVDYFSNTLDEYISELAVELSDD